MRRLLSAFERLLLSIDPTLVFLVTFALLCFLASLSDVPTSLPEDFP